MGSLGQSCEECGVAVVSKYGEKSYTMRKTKNEPLVKRVMDAFPGKKWFGLYRFLPYFFLLGASLEFSMINWTVGDVNFYKAYKKRQALDYLEAKKHSVEEN